MVNYVSLTTASRKHRQNLLQNHAYKVNREGVENLNNTAQKCRNNTRV